MVLFSDMLAQILVERVLLDGEDSKAAVKKEQNEIENESSKDEDGASGMWDESDSYFEWTFGYQGGNHRFDT